MAKAKTNYRDSESGRYTTKAYADKNPKTTEKEKVKPAQTSSKPTAKKSR